LLGLEPFDNNIGGINMTQIIIDTDILIDISNNDETAKSRLLQESQTSVLMISTITVMELMVGCRNKS